MLWCVGIPLSIANIKIHINLCRFHSVLTVTGLVPSTLIVLLKKQGECSNEQEADPEELTKKQGDK